jgi:predicted nucleic-acid-binding Zn-ribbon protein
LEAAPCSTGPRVLTLDIETAPLESYTWGIWDQNIGLNQIKSEWTILSFSAKWLGEKKVIYGDTGGNGPGLVRNDRPLLEQLWALLDNADIVVTQNGKKFDIRKINSRLIMAGFKPYSPIRQVDTCLVAKKHFGFTSNKLEWMSEKLTKAKKSQHKQFPGFSLWSECLKDNPKAWAEMKKYNILDTVSTEELYLKLRPWIDGHPNVAAYTDVEAPACPKCGSRKLRLNGIRRTQTGESKRLRCADCGGSSFSRANSSTPAKRKILLGN